MNWNDSRVMKRLRAKSISIGSLKNPFKNITDLHNNAQTAQGAIAVVVRVQQLIFWIISGLDGREREAR